MGDAELTRTILTVSGSGQLHTCRAPGFVVRRTRPQQWGQDGGVEERPVGLELEGKLGRGKISDTITFEVILSPQKVGNQT